MKFFIKSDAPKYLKDAYTAASRPLYFVAILSLFQGIFVLTLPIYTTQIYQRVLQSGSQSTLIMITVGCILFLGIFALLDYVRNIILSRVGAAFEAALGGPTLISAIHSASAAGSGDVQGLRDLGTLRGFISSPQAASLFDLPFLPLYVVVLSMIDPAMGMIVVIGATLLIIISIATPMLVSQHVKEASSNSLSALQSGQSYVRQAELVQAFGLYPEAVERWGDPNARALNAQDNAAHLSHLLGGLSKFIRMVLQVAIIAAGALLALNGKIGPGVVFAASIIGGRALTPVENVIGLWRNFRNALDANSRLATALKFVPSLERKTQLPRPTGRVDLENVAYVPPGTNRPVLSRISFSAKPGECIGIVGPPGAGKSTLARLLVGAIQPTAGHVRLDGADIQSWNVEDIGWHIGYLPQQPEFFPGTIARNIARMSAKPDNDMLLEAARKSGANDVISRMPQGYETPIGHSQYELSGGQKQRIGLARAFYGSPSIFVLDEPNAALDSVGDAALREAVRTAKSEGATVFIVAQRPSAIELADRVFVMRDGTIESMGTPADVLPRIVAGTQTRK